MTALNLLLIIIQLLCIGATLVLYFRLHALYKKGSAATAERMPSESKSPFRRAKPRINLPKPIKLTGMIAGACVTVGLLAYFVINPVISYCIGHYRVVVNVYNVQNFKVPEGVTSIKEYAFQDCDDLVSVTLPSSVTSIGPSAFGGCDNLQSIEIPEGVTTIGERAFFGCRDLSLVTLPSSLTSIGEEAFRACQSLKSITIPGGVENFGASAFSDCEALTRVTISEGVTGIGDWAFDTCGQITTVVLPSTLESVGYYAFGGCDAVERVYYGGSAENYEAIEFESMPFEIQPCFYSETEPAEPKHYEVYWRYVDGEPTIWELLSYTLRPDGTYEVSGRGTVSDSWVVIPEIYNGRRVKAIGEYAFNNIDNYVEHLIISDGVSEIGSYAFSGSPLSSIVIPASMTYIEEHAFSECRDLYSIFYCGTPEEWENMEVGSSNIFHYTDASLYYYSETRPTDTEYQYWGYIDGIPTPW